MKKRHANNIQVLGIETEAKTKATCSELCLKPAIPLYPVRIICQSLRLLRSTQCSCRDLFVIYFEPIAQKASEIAPASQAQEDRHVIPKQINARFLFSMLDTNCVLSNT